MNKPPETVLGRSLLLVGTVLMVVGIGWPALPLMFNIGPLTLYDNLKGSDHMGGQWPVFFDLCCGLGFGLPMTLGGLLVFVFALGRMSKHRDLPMNSASAVRAFHKEIIRVAEANLGRKLSECEKQFITSRSGFVALESIQYHVKNLSKERLLTYLNSESL